MTDFRGKLRYRWDSLGSHALPPYLFLDTHWCHSYDHGNPKGAVWSGAKLKKHPGNHARFQKKATVERNGARGARFPTKTSTNSPLTSGKQQKSNFTGRALSNKPRVLVTPNTHLSEKYLSCYFSIRTFSCSRGPQRFLALHMLFIGEETEFHRGEVRS